MSTKKSTLLQLAPLGEISLKLRQPLLVPQGYLALQAFQMYWQVLERHQRHPANFPLKLRATNMIELIL
jgi:hypothetical protein